MFAGTWRINYLLAASFALQHFMRAAKAEAAYESPYFSIYDMSIRFDYDDTIVAELHTVGGSVDRHDVELMATDKNDSFSFVPLGSPTRQDCGYSSKNGIHKKTYYFGNLERRHITGRRYFSLKVKDPKTGKDVYSPPVARGGSHFEPHPGLRNRWSKEGKDSKENEDDSESSHDKPDKEKENESKNKSSFPWVWVLIGSLAAIGIFVCIIVAMRQ